MTTGGSPSPTGGVHKMREMMVLPKDFQPTETDVVIGRGKQARTHEGNNRLRGLIEFMIPEYSAAGSNKDEKSYIIKEIVTQIRKSSPDGGFVKFDKSKNRWFEVGDFLAREKISQTFRDAMGDAYSSSNPYKRKRRSFEKKHNAIMDIIKRRRGSSPTSVLQSGTASPPSPPSPEPTDVENTPITPPKPVTTAVDVTTTPAVPPPATVSPTSTPVPGKSPPHHPAAMVAAADMALHQRRPGQIGFARRSMMQFGMQGAAAAAAAADMYSVKTAPMPPLHHPGMGIPPPTRMPLPGMIPPTAMMPPPMGMGMVPCAMPGMTGMMSPCPTGMIPPSGLLHPLPHHPHPFGAGMPHRRVSMPGYNPAAAGMMAADMMQRQRMAAATHQTAMMRRTSQASL